ncbi:hypothetical protein [Anaeromyxobacter oryzae]|uniref:Big-1 domain-containing protein n=1 Tax=Anaeromyxobacter oryzae TaxID=2918170 RepID=A0ABM7WQE8_9BACT|nr:hypothetical protein [Anaeromyxobacter oryzae]BDG01689.1 hypothetical protein AMOR_06850 [Anaeromyxobacter oryzae]
MFRIRLLAAVAALSALAACKSSSKSSNPPAPPLTVTASVLAGSVSSPSGGVAVKANGTNTVRISVAGSTKGPIQLGTVAGTFTSGSTTMSVDLTSPSAVLTVCDARASSGCVGPQTIYAVDGNGALGSVSLAFVGYETTCNDGKDNNGDGKIDCADPDCALLACVTAGGAAGACQNSVCATGGTSTCTSTGPTETCNNNQDDNCDGKIDCADTATCEGQPCKLGSPSFVCSSGVCTDAGSGLGLAVTPARTRLPADGAATTTITVKATKAGEAQAGAQLTLTTDLGVFVTGAGTATSTTAATASDGTATVLFRASGSAGAARITAALTAVPAVNQSAFVTMPALGAIVVESVQSPVMGVKYSGWNEQNQIRVALLDTEQKAYPDGLAVRFEHQQLGRSTISSPLSADTATCLAASGCVGFLGQTASPTETPDSDGLASVNLYSGTAAGLVSVKVTATAGGVTRSFTLQDIAIVGARASGAHLSLECTPRNIPVLAYDHDCINAFYGGKLSPITCTAFFADRFNNVLGKALLAGFASEAGAAGPPVYTAQYDPSSATDQTNELGFATDTVAIDGYALPRDVDPVAGEPSTVVAGDVCTAPLARRHNPRDGLSAIIVMASGEEGFVDLNGNGVWDAGEPFVDQGEPFVDANDNGAYDGGEYFVDLNANGVYDGPNGKWDADTTIWTETRVLYTGAPEPLFTLVNPSPVDVDSTATGGAKAVPTEVVFGFLDENQNPLSPTVTTYAVSSVKGTSTPTITELPNKLDRLGMGFVLKYCDQPAGSPTPATACGAVCTTSPCYVVPSVFGFGNPDTGLLSVKGGANPGGDSVKLTPTVETVIGPGTLIQVNVQ